MDSNRGRCCFSGICTFESTFDGFLAIITVDPSHVSKMTGLALIDSRFRSQKLHSSMTDALTLSATRKATSSLLDPICSRKWTVPKIVRTLPLALLIFGA